MKNFYKKFGAVVLLLSFSFSLQGCNKSIQSLEMNKKKEDVKKTDKKPNLNAPVFQTQHNQSDNFGSNSKSVSKTASKVTAPINKPVQANQGGSFSTTKKVGVQDNPENFSPNNRNEFDYKTYNEAIKLYPTKSTIEKINLGNSDIIETFEKVPTGSYHKDFNDDVEKVSDSILGNVYGLSKDPIKIKSPIGNYKNEGIMGIPKEIHFDVYAASKEHDCLYDDKGTKPIPPINTTLFIDSIQKQSHSINPIFPITKDKESHDIYNALEEPKNVNKNTVKDKYQLKSSKNEEIKKNPEEENYGNKAWNTEKQSHNTSPSLPNSDKVYDISGQLEEQRKDNTIKRFAIAIKYALASFRFDIAQDELKNFEDYLNLNKIDEYRLKKLSKESGIECDFKKTDNEFISKFSRFEKDKTYWNEIKKKKVPTGLVIDLSDFYHENRGSLLTEFFGDKECIKVESGSRFMLTLAEYKLEKVMEDNFTMKDSFTISVNSDFFYNGLFCVINYDNRSRTKDKTLEEKIMDTLSKYYKDNMILVILSKTTSDYKVSLDFVKKTPMSERFGGRVLFHCEKHNDWQTEGKKEDIVLSVKKELTNQMFEIMKKMDGIKIGIEPYKL
jgi:hypothetical protein